MDRLLDWLVIASTFAVVTAIALWMTGAIYYDVCGGHWWGRVVAAVWLVGVVDLFIMWQPFWKPFATLVGVTALFLGWWLRQKPSHNRNWDTTVAVLPRALRTDDVVTIENVRNFQYRSLDDFTVHYETRSVHLENLKAADLLISYWGSPWMAHPILIFDFGPDGRICMSIEVRYQKGQEYSILRSLYRQLELIFVAADERDVILRRTKFGKGQEAYLYRFQASPEELRTAFLDYVEAINRLYETPRWYHGLFANCTTSFYRMPHSRFRIDWRVLANGRLDRALYEADRLDRTLPFEELRRNASLNAIANSAPTNGFGDYIRRELERRQHE